MALKDTIKHMKDLLCQISTDIEKSDGGNKAASQRVRTGTVKLEKIAKKYRKESIQHEKSNKGSRRAAGKKPAAAKKTMKKATPPAAAKGKAMKMKPKAKAKAAK